MSQEPMYREDDHWQQRFRAQRISWAKVANLNRLRGLVNSDRDGLRQLYAWDVATGDLRRLTDKPAGVVEGLLSADGRYVYYMRDEGGSEIGHYVRVPFEGGPEEDVTPDLPPYGSFALFQSFEGNLLGTRIADESGQKLMVFAPGEAPHQTHHTRSLFFGPALSFAGEIAVIATTEGTGSIDTRLIAFDVASGEAVAELWDGPDTSHSLGEFAPLSGDFRLLSTTSRSGYGRPLIWDPRSGGRRDLVLDDIPGEVTPLQWSRDARRVLLRQLHEARTRLYVYELESDEITRLNHPDGLVGGGADGGVFSEDGRILITWQDPAHPPRLIALDGQTGAMVETVLAAGEVPPGRPWQSITYTSANGAPIQAWLAVPEGEGPFPTIFHVHGGPTAVMAAYYSPESQAWLDHGFAFFSINYHGSTTFGKPFEKSIMGRLGELELQDMAAGYEWLVGNNIALPDAVLLEGASYGGYLTLQALGNQPELWAGGLASVAIADWTAMYEDQSEMLRSYQRILFGGTPSEKPAEHRRSSPITYAEQVKAPLLVIQGSNDTRCPPGQMRAYEARLQSLGKRIDVHWFEAGHGSHAQEQQLEHQALKLRFAQQVLDRR